MNHSQCVRVVTCCITVGSIPGHTVALSKAQLLLLTIITSLNPDV